MEIVLSSEIQFWNGSSKESSSNLVRDEFEFATSGSSKFEKMSEKNG